MKKPVKHYKDYIMSPEDYKKMKIQNKLKKKLKKMKNTILYPSQLKLYRKKQMSLTLFGSVFSV